MTRVKRVDVIPTTMPTTAPTTIEELGDAVYVVEVSIEDGGIGVGKVKPDEASKLL